MTQLMTVNALTLSYMIPALDALDVPGGVPAPAAEEPSMVLVHTGQRVRGFTSYTRTRLIFELESGGQVRIWDAVSTYVAADGAVHAVCSSKVHHQPNHHQPNPLPTKPPRENRRSARR